MDFFDNSSFNTFLCSLLGPTPPLNCGADTSPLLPPPPSAIFQHDLEGCAAQGNASTSPESGSSGAGANKGAEGRKRDNSSKGNQGRRLQLLRLKKELSDTQQEHQQQLRRKLYLTTRVDILELLEELHKANEARHKQVRAGLTYNPFAAYDTTVEEFMREGLKPKWFVQRFQRGVQIMAGRLATCLPLVRKYPHLATHRPPEHLLEQLRTELSLAEPTNPYGADGFVTGSLTLPIPETIIARLFESFGLSDGDVRAADRTTLESFATLVLEQHGCAKACQHAYTVYPSIFTGDAVHLDASACSPSWEAVMALLSKVRVDGPDDSTAGSTANTLVAPKAHWQKVVEAACLTNKQKLQAFVLWEILGTTQQAIRLVQAQLAIQLTQVCQPRDQQTGAPLVQPQQQSAVKTASSRTDQWWWLSPQQQQWQGQLRSAVGDSSPAGNTAESAAAIYSLGPDQLTQQEATLQRLNSTLEKERHLKFLIATALYSCTFGAIQETKAFAIAHPFMPAAPDILSVCAEGYTSDVMDALVAEALASTSMQGG